jgi:hypothetical protein
MVKTLTLKNIIGRFRSRWEKAPDVRKANNNTRYQVVDAILAGFSVFFMQSRSFLEHQRLMQGKKGRNNASKLFGIERIPSDPKYAVSWTQCEQSISTPISGSFWMR